MKVYIMYADTHLSKHGMKSADIEKFAKTILTEFKHRLKRIIPDVTIIFVSNEEIRKLNNKYRNIDKPTDVLSFNSEEDGYLGDIIIAPETVAAYGKKFGCGFEEELKRDVIHGIMHLLGYDHSSHLDTDAQEEMFVVQEDILKKYLV